MIEIRFTIPGKPVPKGRPRVNRKTGAVYTPRETKDYERTVAGAFLAAGQGKPNHTGAVALDIEVFPDRVEVALQLRESPAPKHKADLDNILKSVADGLQRVGAFNDDRQIEAIGATWQGE